MPDDRQAPGDPLCSRCGHSFRRHEPHGVFECLADIGGAPCGCAGFTHIFKGQEKAAADYQPPSRQEHQEAGLEVYAGVLAILANDLHRLNEVVFGSERPVHEHALEAMFGLAFVICQSDDPARALEAWRNTILNIGGAL